MRGTKLANAFLSHKWYHLFGVLNSAENSNRAFKNNARLFNVMYTRKIIFFSFFLFLSQEVDYEGFKVFYNLYLGAGAPVELCENLFLSFVKKPGTTSSTPPSPLPTSYSFPDGATIHVGGLSLFFPLLFLFLAFCTNNIRVNAASYLPPLPCLKA